jgi:hypothetical protein
MIKGVGRDRMSPPKNLVATADIVHRPPIDITTAQIALKAVHATTKVMTSSTIL